MKTIRLFVVTCLFGALPCFLYAQKDAPVAGDAARLVDFLKKDYNALPPEQRQEAMLQDMNTVAGVFKGYLEDGKKYFNCLNCTSLNKTIELNNQSTAKLREEKGVLMEQIKAIGQVNDKNLTEFQTINARLNVIEVTIDNNKTQKIKDGLQLQSEQLTAIKNQYPDNYYISTIIDKFIKKYQDQNNGYDPFAAPNYSSAIPKSLPFLGGDLNFQVVMDGLARFIAKRLKEELTNSVLRDIKRELQFPDPQSPVNELKVLLPKTTEYLMQFTVDQITNFSDEIKQYLEKDLENLLHNAVNLKTTPRFKGWIQQYPDLDFAFEALEFIPQVSQLKQPLDYFTLMENSRNLSRWAGSTNQIQRDIAHTFQLSSLLAHSLVIVEEGQIRIAGVDFMGQYAAEPDFYQLYLGFLYQQTVKYYNDLQVGEVIFKDELNNLVNGSALGNLNLIKSVLTQTTASAEKVYTAALEIKRLNKSGQKIGADTLLNFVEGMIAMAEDFVRAGDTLYKNLSGTSIQLAANCTSYFTYARSGLNIARDIQHKKYASAIESLLKLVLNPNAGTNISSLYQVLEQISNEKHSEILNSWAFLYEYLYKGYEWPDSNEKKGKKISLYLISEIDNIIHYEKILNPAVTANAVLIDFKTTLFNLSNQGQFSETESAIFTNSSIYNYIKSPTFQTLLLSYYFRVDINSMIRKVGDELGKLKIGTTPVFTSVQITQFEADIKSAIQQYFDDVIMNGQKSSPEAWRKIWLSYSQISAALPQAFRLADYPLVTKLIHFVNDMALAKNSEDVEKAIEAIALPSGSYSIKRASRFNAALNSYPGLLAGNEVAYKQSAAFSTGFTAPVGLSFAWGSKKGYSNGFFIPVIDLGALVRLHFDNTSETASLPDFNFINVFSPGIYYHLGLRNSPLSLHVGGQYAPKLRRQVNDDPVESLFLGAGLTVDIPLLNFHTRPRNIRR